MNKRYFSNSGETGHIVEEEILGTCHVQWDGKMYHRYMESMELARKCQSGDPSAPILDGARKLHVAVATQMKISDRRSLQLYSAVGTPLDRFHGVDGWFEFQGVVITFDLTLSTQKDVAKADVVIHAQELEDNFEFAARDVADAFYWATKAPVRKAPDVFV
ncbi:MAG: hypothetical protein M3Q80_00415 [bacterium]|nr:hypothetical protein [bacterium]